MSMNRKTVSKAKAAALAVAAVLGVASIAMAAQPARPNRNAPSSRHGGLRGWPGGQTGGGGGPCGEKTGLSLDPGGHVVEIRPALFRKQRHLGIFVTLTQLEYLIISRRGNAPVIHPDLRGLLRI